ncbi:MAG: hypothetical protein AABX98_05985, partial [Nanoarchaeota archaeon]
MTLTDLVRAHYGKEIIKGINIPNGEIQPGYASHIEQKYMSSPNAVRMGRSWDRPPTERKLEENKIGSNNLGLPPLVATLMQQLRESNVNPENPEHVQKFQREMAQVTQLVTPLIIADVIRRKYSAATPAEIECEAYIIGVDAKRRLEGGAAHGGKIVGIDLKKPSGYNSSEYSQLVSDAYVFPKQYEKPDILIVIDPMLATGLSSKVAIEGCLETLALQPSDVYCTSFFAGGYRGIKTLLNARFTVQIVAHDQLPLSSD